jgi:hypothetical protein
LGKPIPQNNIFIEIIYTIMSYYPRSLQYTLKELSGYSRNKFKLLPNVSQSQTMGAGDTIIVPLPQNTIVSLDDFQWFFKAKCNGNGVALPRHIETLVSEIAIEVNGIMVDNIREYNTLFARLAGLTMGDKETIRGVLQNGIGFSTEASMSNVSTFTAYQQYSVWSWLGWLGQVQPRCIDTSILGDVRIHITLAGNEALVAGAYGAGVSAPSYTTTDHYFLVDTISLNDGVYYDVVQKRLGSDNPIELPFQTWTFFSPGQTSLDQTTTGTLSTSSLDMLIGTYKDSNLRTNDFEAVNKSSTFFKTGSSNLTGSYFLINSVQYPSTKANPAQAFAGTLGALNLSQDVLGACDATLSNLTNWQNSAFMHALRLNHPVGSDERVRSGLNLKGTNSTIQFVTEGTETNVVPMLFAGSTAVLKVGAYKQIELSK